MEEGNGLTLRSKLLGLQIVLLIGMLLFFWHLNRTPNTSNVLEGKIFSYQLYLRPYDKWSPTGYIAFGSKQDNFGVLWYLDQKKGDIEELNKEGEIAIDLTNAYKSHHLYWDTGDDGSSISLPNGLALVESPGNPIMGPRSYWVTKTSGIFKKTIYCTDDATDDEGNSRTTRERLVEVGRIRQ